MSEAKGLDLKIMLVYYKIHISWKTKSVTAAQSLFRAVLIFSDTMPLATQKINFGFPGRSDQGHLTALPIAAIQAYVDVPIH